MKKISFSSTLKSLLGLADLFGFRSKQPSLCKLNSPLISNLAYIVSIIWNWYRWVGVKGAMPLPSEAGGG